MEQPLYIPAEPGPLFGILHRPEGEAPPRAAVLFLPPALDEKRASYGAMARLARALAGAGCAVLRFDYHGTGDSAGDSVDVSVGSMERDAGAAAAFLRGRFPGAELVLVGVRLGASLALALGARLGAARVAAVAPIASGANWLRQERGRRTLRRSMIARELAGREELPDPLAVRGSEAFSPPGAAEDLEGLPLSAGLIAELGALDLLAGEPPAPGAPAALLVQVSPRKSPLAETEALARRFGARVECLGIESFWQPLEHPSVDELAGCLREFAVGASP